MVKKCTKKFIFITSLLFCNCAISNQETKSYHNNVVYKEAATFFQQQLDFTVNASGVKKVVEGSAKDVLIVDIRDKESYDEGHIPGAINLPYDHYKGRGDSGPFAGCVVEFNGMDKSKLHYIYCYTPDCNLSLMACRRFSELGYRVKEFKGGFTNWTDLNYPVESNSQN